MPGDLTPSKFPQNFSPKYWRDYDYGAFSPWKRDYEWSPFAGFRREMHRLFDDFFNTPAVSGYDYGQAQFGSFWPTFDIKESDDEVIVTAEVPGMNEKDVELYLDKGVLTIRGLKKADKDEPCYSERFYGRFERQIALPYSVDTQHCSAEFRDGLLSVKFEKLAAADNKKKIPINAATAHKGRLGHKQDDVKERRSELIGA